MSETLFNNTMSKIEKYGFTIIYTHNESINYGYTIGMGELHGAKAPVLRINRYTAIFSFGKQFLATGKDPSLRIGDQSTNKKACQI